MVNPSITFYALESNNKEFAYVVIAAMYNNKWIWVRQKRLKSWEIPGGHVEQGETPEDAARRELWEETGATEYTITPVCDFSVNSGITTSYNRLFFANVTKLDEMPTSEIEQISFFTENPKLLTHKQIQPILLDKVKVELGLINS